jgi:hypothetical protein
MSVTFANIPRPWTFMPQDDMTPDELVAMFKAIAPALNMQLTSDSTYRDMPENVKRHFQRKPMSNNAPAAARAALEGK